VNFDKSGIAKVDALQPVAEGGCWLIHRSHGRWYAWTRVDPRDQHKLNLL
jgi:hypothetical protein